MSHPQAAEPAPPSSGRPLCAVVPEQAKPGQQLIAKTPSGVLLKFIVPSELPPSRRVLVAAPPEAATLAP